MRYLYYFSGTVYVEILVRVCIINCGLSVMCDFDAYDKTSCRKRKGFAIAYFLY
jgi:hypothetical protein